MKYIYQNLEVVDSVTYQHTYDICDTLTKTAIGDELTAINLLASNGFRVRAITTKGKSKHILMEKRSFWR